MRRAGENYEWRWRRGRVSGDPRCRVAEDALERGGTVGIQVLNEFAHVASRKLRWERDRVERALQVIEALLGPPLPLTAAVHARALGCARRHHLPFYDALIVGAAQEAGCRKLISEDFQHGRRFGEVLVSNPFAARENGRRGGRAWPRPRD